MKNYCSAMLSCVLHLYLILYLVLGLPLPWFTSSASSNVYAKETPSNEAALQTSFKQLEEFTQSLQKTQSQLDRSHFDPQAIVTNTGRDYEKLFTWIKQHTKLVAYRGSLRGPQGVLSDRVGNTLDRALLLDQLLTLAGYQTRLAHGELDPQQTLALASDSRYGSYYQAHRIHYPDAKAASESERALAVIMETAFDRIEQQGPELLTQLETTRVPFEKLKAQELQLAADKLSDHWWVQVRNGNEWLNLDPTLATPGATRIEAQANHSSRKLPTQLLHQISVRLILERWDNNQAIETTLLNYTAPATEYAKQTIFVGHAPLGLEQNKLIAAKDIPSLIQQAEQAKAWLPVIVVDNQIAQAEYFFTVDGKVLSTEKENLKAYQTPQSLSEIGNTMGGAVSRLSKTFDLVEEPDEKKSDNTEANQPSKALSNNITAEWLEYEIRVPGETTRMIRREVFDLIGAQARTEGKLKPPKLADPQAQQRIASLLGGTQIRINNAKTTSEVVTEQLAKKLTELQPLIEKLARSPNSLSASDANKYYPAIQTLQIDLDALSLLRWSWNWGSEAVYVDQPNILALKQNLKITDEKDWRQLKTIDIVTNEVGVGTLPGLDPFQARLMQGVADTVAEASLTKPNIKSLNTSVLHELASIEGIKRITLPPDTKQKNIPQHSAQATARITQDLDTGHVVILPKKAVQLNNEAALAWWRIDPNSGTTLGITPDGAGAMTTERGLIQAMGATLVVGSAIQMQDELVKFFDSIAARLITVLNEITESGTDDGAGTGTDEGEESEKETETDKPPAKEYDIETPGNPEKDSVGGPLSVDDAVDEVKAGGDVIAKDKETAKEIAIKVGGGRPPVHDAKGHKDGRPHYHPNGRPGGHIFY